MVRKAKAGHVTGGRVFGYDNVRVERPRRAARSTRPQAAVIRRIFALCADGHRLHAHREAVERRGRLDAAPDARRPAWLEPVDASTKCCIGRSIAAR